VSSKIRLIQKAIAGFVLLLLCITCKAQKTDKLYLKNGDILTGEILNMQYAMLTVKTDAIGTASFKWEEIDSISSKKYFSIGMSWGEIVVSRFDSAFFAESPYAMDDIIDFVQFRKKFINRLSGNIDMGFNYARSSDITQFNLGSSTHYRMPKFESALDLNSYLTYDGDSLLTKKNDVKLSGLKYLEKRYFVQSSIGWQQNTELGIAGRTIFNITGGSTPIADNHNRLYTAAGLSFNHEVSVDEKTNSNNIDALFVIAYKRFYYSFPKFSVDVNYYIFPGLTNWGRIRMEANLNTKIELFRDFTLGLVFYYNYDNKPPMGASSKTDYGVNFTLGYVFGK
jgi:hypothetical protein